MAINKVICVECSVQGLKSTVLLGGMAVTAMAVDRYYDEDGNYHSHDANIRSTGFSCSNGHTWSTQELQECPQEGCKWNERRLRRLADL